MEVQNSLKYILKCIQIREDFGGLMAHYRQVSEADMETLKRLLKELDSFRREKQDG